MGYTRLVQYGNITEIYQYEKPRNRNQEQSHAKIQRIIDKKCHISNIVKPKQGNLLTKPQTSIGLSLSNLPRKQSAINRTLRDFFRLTHHNVVNAKTIHFVTLTFAFDLTYEQALNALKKFINRTQQYQKEVPISYISVPELTKKNRYHFHLLIFDLLPQVSGLPLTKRGKKTPSFTTERDTRLLQN